MVEKMRIGTKLIIFCDKLDIVSKGTVCFQKYSMLMERNT